jgi:hypothetical protein
MKQLFLRISRPLAVLLVILIPPMSAFAGNYGTGTFGTCQFGACSISISSNGALNANVTPTAAGRCTISSDVVSVLTDNSAGYMLTLANSSISTALIGNSTTIPATTATQAAPSALAVNRWGYRVDGLGSFGAGPTSTQTNIALNSTTFAGVPASNATADVLANTSTPANPAVNTTVWYGVCADTTARSGAYSTQAIYTAVTN